MLQLVFSILEKIVNKPDDANFRKLKITHPILMVLLFLKKKKIFNLFLITFTFLFYFLKKKMKINKIK